VQLNKLNKGYEEHTIKTKVSHLIYRDDLKLRGKTEEELQKQMQTARNFSGDIRMEFVFDKCAKFELKERKISSLTILNICFQRRGTRARTGKNIEVHRY